MSLTDVHPNGNGDTRNTVFRLLDGDPSLTRDELSEALGGSPGPRQCGNLRREWKETRGSEAPSTEPAASPAAGSSAAAPVASKRKRPATRVEVPQRAARKGRGVEPDVVDRWVRVAVGCGVTAIGLIVSYSHVRHLAVQVGASWPSLLPLQVDGLMAAAVLCLRRHRRYWPARFALAIGILGMLALNALAERPDLAAPADVRLGMAVMAPITAAFGVHLVTKR